MGDCKLFIYNACIWDMSWLREKDHVKVTRYGAASRPAWHQISNCKMIHGVGENSSWKPLHENAT